MKNKLFSLILILVIGYSEAQTNKIELDFDEYEVINQFLMKFGLSKKYFLDKNISYSIESIDKLKNQYKYQVKFYESMKFTCMNSKDTLELKFACPLEDSFKPYINLLYDHDFEYMKKNLRQSKVVLDLEKLEMSVNIKPHNNSSSDNSETNKDEFPSIKLHGLYRSKDKTVIAIAYHIKNDLGFNDNPITFYLFKKQKNIWWKPIGQLKL